jgi:hypothetical protein
MNQKLVDFEKLISESKANENNIQNFMEANTMFMPTPDVLNHRLHLNCIIAKFPIGERSTDYAYLTKSTVEWRLVLVELEDSSKRIFKKSSKNTAFTVEFSDAVAQIGVWRDHVSQHLDQVREKLRPLLVPPQMERNKLSVRYVLVIGRSAEFEEDESRRLRLANFGEDHNLRIITYDSILREVRDGHAAPNAVLRANSRGYLLQSVEAMPSNMFAYIKPSQLDLSKEADRKLRDEMYDIDAWKQNKMLTINEKWTAESRPDLYKSMHPNVKSLLIRNKSAD